MEALVHELGTVRLRKIDIDRWDSPVARQYDIHSIPQLRLYRGPELVASGTRAVMQRLSAE